MFDGGKRANHFLHFGRSLVVVRNHDWPRHTGRNDTPRTICEAEVDIEAHFFPVVATVASDP